MLYCYYSAFRIPNSAFEHPEVFLNDTMTPRQIVEELDQYVIGQNKAKRAVAIALRNRWRRQRLPQELRDEVMPKNIIMIGPTGVGKTEIARRLAKLVQAPFLKIEASKFTEVGYVGRDVDSIIRDLTEIGINMVKNEVSEQVQEKAAVLAEERLLDLLLPPVRTCPGHGERRQKTSRNSTAARGKSSASSSGQASSTSGWWRSTSRKRSCPSASSRTSAWKRSR